MRRAALIYNPKSGRQRHAAILDAVIARLAGTFAAVANIPYYAGAFRLASGGCGRRSSRRGPGCASKSTATFAPRASRSPCNDPPES